jgi:hypothetical protein
MAQDFQSHYWGLSIALFLVKENLAKYGYLF